MGEVHRGGGPALLHPILNTSLVNAAPVESTRIIRQAWGRLTGAMALLSCTPSSEQSSLHHDQYQRGTPGFVKSWVGPSPLLTGFKIRSKLLSTDWSTRFQKPAAVKILR